MFFKNVDLKPPLELSPFRKIAMGTWKTAGDPSVYGVLEVNVRPALQYLQKISQKSTSDVEAPKLTLTHFTGKAVAETIRRHPQINCIMRLGRLYPRKTVDLFFQVASDKKGVDLSGSVIRCADQKTIANIAAELQGEVNQIRQKGDPAFRKMKGTMGMIPGFLCSYLINFMSFLTYTLNVWSPLFGSPRDPFGSVMITSIGSLGLEMAFAPLVPYSRIPILIAVGAAVEKPVVRDGKVEVGLMSSMCVTFDHRVMDGVHASHMAASLRSIFENPEKELGNV